MRAPEFWRRHGIAVRALAPLGAAWTAAAWLRRRAARPARIDVPVLCVGNLTVGGAGKTPVALAVARTCATLGRSPHFLARGHGGNLTGPVRVDPACHGARDVGDEPLLLAAMAPTWVARDRAAGARAAAAAGAAAIVMDDGFQNPSVAKDLSLIVVDGGYGFGNAKVMPAGPLREPIEDGLARADAVVIVGVDSVGVVRMLAGRLPLLRARIVPAPSAEPIMGRPVIAFAGIGRPAKFFATVAEMGCEIVATHPFADHHRFRGDEIMAIVNEAAAAGAVAVTTAKDAARLPPDLRALVEVVEIDLEWEDPEALERLVSKALSVVARRQAADA